MIASTTTTTVMPTPIPAFAPVLSLEREKISTLVAPGDSRLVPEALSPLEAVAIEGRVVISVVLVLALGFVETIGEPTPVLAAAVFTAASLNKLDVKLQQSCYPHTKSYFCNSLPAHYLLATSVLISRQRPYSLFPPTTAPSIPNTLA